MTLRNIIAGVAITGMVMATATAPALAGDANSKTKKVKTASVVKKTEQTQGTFAYRFETFTQYTSSGSLCSSTDPTCTQQMNTDLRSGSSTLFPSVKKPEGEKPNSVNTTKATTPAND